MKLYVYKVTYYDIIFNTCNNYDIISNSWISMEHQLHEL